MASAQKTANGASKKKDEAKPRPVWKTVFWGALIFVVGREAYLGLYTRRNRRRDIFNLAQARAKETGKQLVVVGDPDAGFVNRVVGRDYDCGDLCLDRHGCLKCDNYITGRLEDVLSQLPSNSAVVYVSAVLEYVHDIDLVLSELERVSGGDLYVVTVEPRTLTAWLWPGSQRRFFESPPEGAQLKWSTLPWASTKSKTTRYQLSSGGP